MTKIKAVPKFQGYYATEAGDIMRLNENGGSILRAYKDRNGYLRVQVGGRFQFVHRLVASAFLDNPSDLPCINHIDGNPLNNCVDNLEWCTYKYNNTHKVHDKRATKPHKHGFVCIENGQVIAHYAGFKDLPDGFSPNCISKALRGVRPNYRGYEWKYASNESDKTIEFEF